MATNRDWCAHYILNGRDPVPCPDHDSWYLWFAGQPDRYVAETTIDGKLWVSTVFFGLNYAAAGEEPNVFETAVVSRRTGDYVWIWRTSTWDKAEVGHKIIAQHLSAGGSLDGLNDLAELRDLKLAGEGKK